MRRLPVAILLILTLSAQGGSGVRCSDARVGSAHFRTCELTAEQTGWLSLASVDASGRPIGMIARLDSVLRTRKRRLLFAMNAGIYERPGVTTGLLIVDSDMKTPLDTSAGPPGRQPVCERSNFYCPPNGVFLITSAGRAHVWTTAQFAHKYGTGRFAAGVRLAT